jgi:DNA repair exonuclease SbcCD ATPase subunit
MGIEPYDLRVKSKQDLKAIMMDADPAMAEKSINIFIKKSEENFQFLSAQIKKTRLKLKEKAEEAKRLMAEEEKINESIQKHRIIEEERRRRVPQEPKVDRELQSRPGSKYSVRPLSNASRFSRQQSAKKSASSLDRSKLHIQPHVVSDAIKEEAVKQIEDMVEHEIHLQRIKEHRIKHFEAQIREKKQDLEKKIRKVNHLLTEHEKETMLAQFHKKIERDVREFEIEVNRRAHELEQRVKAEKIMQENERMAALQKEREDYRRRREQIRNQLMQDVGKMREGLISPDQLQTKYAYLKKDADLDTLFDAHIGAARSKSGRLRSASSPAAQGSLRAQPEALLRPLPAQKQREAPQQPLQAQPAREPKYGSVTLKAWTTKHLLKKSAVSSTER